MGMGKKSTTTRVAPSKKGADSWLPEPSTPAQVAQGLVGQEGRMGCGLACVASVLRISYKRANRLAATVGVRGNDRWPGYWPRALQALLDYAGQPYARSKFGATSEAERHRQAMALPRGSIVFVRDTGDYRWGHYLVRMPGGWMDPAKGRLVRKLPACPKSYLKPATG